MGNNNTREARQPPHGPAHAQAVSSAHAPQAEGSRPRTRNGRSDLGGFLSLSSNPLGGHANPPERRETRQEREARRLEKERQARLVERERSMREEHVDGGYLVTLGTYVGVEDFNKAVVRQLQIERRLAPFWRGLPDFSDTWTEYQLAAAARGLPIPPPDQPPPDGFFYRPPTSSTESPPQLPGDQALAASTSVLSTSPASGSLPTGPLAGTSSPSVLLAPATTTTTTSLAAPATRGSSSPFKPRAKALAAALSVSSRNASSTDIAPREIALPHDPYVNGQPIEVFLYKDAEECPICFLSYPPYLNHTRCCGQAICSECFVQIKRTEPHYPEGHGDGHGDTPENADGMHPEEQAGLLISEPACCPYCQQSEFGVTYDPPPFRRGFVYSPGALSSGIGAMGAAMSSSSSIGSAMSPTSLTAPSANAPQPGSGTGTPGSRRRTQSLSATAPNVVTTDRVRPDWATKLASQRAHIARRAAAATALHTAAFLMGSQEARAPRTSRFGRRSAPTVNDGANDSEGSPATGLSDGAADTMEPGPRTSSGHALATPLTPRRTRMEDLEELMFREALRQSLATEEERRRKEEAKERKEAKRREKDERKAAKVASKRQRQNSGSGGLYPAGAGNSTDSGHSSASASSLSLSLSSLALGRRRGNSAASNLRVEASVANAIAVSGGGGAVSPPTGGGSASGSVSGSANGSGQTSGIPGPVADGQASGGDALPTAASSDSLASDAAASGNKGKAVDRRVAPGPEALAESNASPSTSSAPRFIPSPQPSAGPSHLRQMSSASSVSSSLPESPAGSFPNAATHLQDPRASGLSLGSRSAASEDADHADDRDASTSTEAMFNFSSLAEIVGVQLEGRHAGRRLSAIAREEKADTAVAGAAAGSSTKTVETPMAKEEHVEHAENAEDVGHAAPSEPASGTQHIGTLKNTPEVVVTSEAPVAGHESL